ncbi:reverse transcriptase [Gossypium australe]|uniref:Reverse transcriptase n=1 Tax=Gossypium australe TaxID=47621 RepID=A0A5B6UTN5_9ROSI|nr:reverse transcriptase [Gossypium australe]
MNIREELENLSMHKRKINRIIALRNINGDWLYDLKDIQEEAINYFKKLYGEKPCRLGKLSPSRFPPLKDSDIDFLQKEVTNEEIKTTLFDMAPLKAPKSDGYHAFFFQNQWDNIGGAECAWTQNLNNTLIVLIPKIAQPEKISQFRPISLYNVLYKLVMKVIANRFKIVFPKIISQEQAGFIVGRNITNNIIIAQEVIHSMRGKNKKWMAIKINLEKILRQSPMGFH